MKSLLTILACITLWGNLLSQQLVHDVLLGRPTDHSITIQAFFDSTVEARVQYGIAPGNYSGQSDWQIVEGDSPVEVVLDSLQANTRYYYRMRYRTPGTNQTTNLAEHTFVTARPPGEAFTFVIQADPHMDEQSDTAIYERCILNQLADAPDFVMDLGDNVMTDKLKNANNEITWDTIHWRTHFMRSFYEPLVHSAPLFMVLGNHEGEAGWFHDSTENNIAVWNTLERQKYFLNPIPDDFYTGDTTQNLFVGLREDYYSWQWGDALFIVLDPYWNTLVKPDTTHGWRWTLGETQYTWLKETLENSTSTFKFIFCHQLVGGGDDGRGGIEFSDLYEWGGHETNGNYTFEENRPGWYAPLKQIFMENEVTIFFHGHDHFFAKQERDCLIYQECPQPSHPNFSNANQSAVYGYVEGLILPNSGHLRLHVSPESVQVDYVRVYKPEDENAQHHNGDISATYTIPEGYCYDSLAMDIPVLWNAEYSDELVFPNPFQQRTCIALNSLGNEDFTLVIRDMQGRILRTLPKMKNVARGIFHYWWDGTSDQNLTLPNGVYLCDVHGSKSGHRNFKIILEN